jgi:hypothetical protein
MTCPHTQSEIIQRRGFNKDGRWCPSCGSYYGPDAKQWRVPADTAYIGYLLAETDAR